MLEPSRPTWPSAEDTDDEQSNPDFGLSSYTDPSCSPPMDVQWSNIVLTDQTSGITIAL